MAKPGDRIGDVRAARLKPVADLPEVTKIDEGTRDRARRIEAVALRLAGLTYDQIGQRLEVTSHGAQELIARSLGSAENLAAEQMRDIEGARLDRAQASIWAKVLDGDLQAVDAFLRISQRRSLLFGLDAPKKVDLKVTVRQEMLQALESLERVVLGEVVKDDGPPAIESG